MGDTLTDRQRQIIARAGFDDRVDRGYSAPGREAVRVISEVVAYFEAHTPGPEQTHTLPFVVETQIEQPFEVLFTIVHELGATDIRIDDNGYSPTPRAALQDAVRQVFLRLGRSARATIDRDEEILPVQEAPETGDGEDAPHVP